MDELMQVITNYGLLGTLVVIMLYMGFIYLPKVVDIYIDRLRKRDYREELLTKTVENCTRVIENNNIIIQAYTENSNKLEEKVDVLISDFKSYDKRAEEILQEVKIIKHQKS